MQSSQICTRKPISRRYLLKGAGAALLGLPILEAMGPSLGQRALGAVASQAPHRFVAMCATLGFHTPFLFPEKEGRDYEMTPYLKKLADHKDVITAISGLSHPEQQGNNGHSSEMTWLTSAQRPGLAGFKNTISLDQLIADQIGIETRFPYLALSTSGRSLSWTSSGVEIPAMRSPAKLYQELFIEGTPDQINKELNNLKRGRSILDTIGARAKRLEQKLSFHDREKVEEYMTAVRDLEFRLQQSEGWVKKPKPQVGATQPKDIEDRNDAIGKQKLLYDMMILALQTDSTRAITFTLTGMNAVPTIQGVNTDWHNLSHHGKDPEKIDELRVIEEAEFDALNYFLTGMRKVKEQGKTLLDNTSVLYGSNLGNASAHSWRNLPVLVAGGGYRHSGYVAHDEKDNTPFANLFVTFAQRMGLEIDQFGSSTQAGVRGLEV